jgi:hypothetical protein
MSQFTYLMPDGKSFGSFNVNKVIRTIPHGKHRVVLLDDGHEESISVGIDPKNKQEKKERKWFDSQIEINEADSIRFLNEHGGTLPEIPVVEEGKEEEKGSEPLLNEETA